MLVLCMLIPPVVRGVLPILLDAPAEPPRWHLAPAIHHGHCIRAWAMYEPWVIRLDIFVALLNMATYHIPVLYWLLKLALRRTC